MKAQLDEKQELMAKVERLSAAELRAVKVFIAGLDAGKALQARMKEPVTSEREQSA